MKIVYKKVEDLKPYVNNPRFNDEAVEQVANSIKEFGFKVPMVIDKDNVIVAGHTRYKASLELGLKEVPCIVADDLTEEQIKAFRLADNKVSEKSSWNFELLDEELNDLDIDMSEFGFDIDIDTELDDGIEQKKEEQELNAVDPSSFIYMGAVSVYGETGDSIVYCDINKDLANKIIKVIEDKGENVVSDKIMEALNDL